MAILPAVRSKCPTPKADHVVGRKVMNMRHRSYTRTQETDGQMNRWKGRRKFRKTWGRKGQEEKGDRVQGDSEIIWHSGFGRFHLAHRMTPEILFTVLSMPL